MIPYHLQCQILCAWFSESSIIWFHYVFSLQIMQKLYPPIQSGKISNQYTLIQQTCFWAYSVSRSVHVTEIYTVLEPKNQVLTSSFSKTLCEFFLPSHSSLTPIQTPIHDLILDLTKIDSNKINSITLIWLQKPTHLFKNYWFFGYLRKHAEGHPVNNTLPQTQNMVDPKLIQHTHTHKLFH